MFEVETMYGYVAKTHLTNPMRMLCPVMNLGPSRLMYTYEAIMPPQLPPMTCIAMPVPLFKDPPILPGMKETRSQLSTIFSP